MTLVQQLQLCGEKNAAQINSSQPLSSSITQLLSLSDFATKVIARDPSLAVWLEESCQLRDVPMPLADNDLESMSEMACFKLLRDYRNQYWLKVAYLDLVKRNDIQDSMTYISSLSETLVHSAYSWAYAQVAKINGTPRDSDGNAMPMLILGMGKLGGGELNYSSDIDLIFSYPFPTDTQGGRKSIEAQVFFTKVAQKTIAALNQVTPDGQVFRVDMRLRPFGDSGPLVMSFNAMEEYYQEQGRDWERYAMLKGRLLGEPSPHWQTFYQLLKPFVYRRYIDFSVIESLRKMKSLISQDVRRKGLTNNIKLGAGGIREVEFVVQAFQMIRGGREASLQTQSLLDALTVLVELEEVNEKSDSILRDGYLFLRRIEQYLQQFDDKQTQTLPLNELDQARLTALLEQSSYQDTLQLIDNKMQCIHAEFAAMIGDDDDNGEQIDSRFELLWAKPQEDVFEQSELLAIPFGAELREFKVASSKRKIGNRGRDILDKLMPKVLCETYTQQYHLQVFKSVLAVLEKVQSRTAYLELLLENLGALKQVFKLCHHSRWIANQLARYPILLDELIDPAQLYRPLPLSAYQHEIRQYFLRIDEHDLELQMEALRQFKQTQQLKIAAADATQVLDVTKVSDHLTSLAEAVVQQCVELAWQQMVARFGYPAGCSDEQKGFAVIAYGKAGGIELGYDSDLDLVFVHNCHENLLTTGDKQIDSRQFYLKLAQRLMHLFNTRTASGILYELDTRLRPEGASGLLAINIETFNQYQCEQAWTWEHQALVRARMIYGQADLQTRFNEIRRSVLSLSRDSNTLCNDVVSMRTKMREHLDKSTETDFDIKQGVGGMADIEFLAQYLVLNHSHCEPSMTSFQDNMRIFEKAAENLIISELEKSKLIDAYCDYRDSYHILSLRECDKRVDIAHFEQHIRAVSKIWQKHLATA